MAQPEIANFSLRSGQTGLRSDPSSSCARLSEGAEPSVEVSQHFLDLRLPGRPERHPETCRPSGLQAAEERGASTKTGWIPGQWQQRKHFRASCGFTEHIESWSFLHVALCDTGLVSKACRW